MKITTLLRYCTQKRLVMVAPLQAVYKTLVFMAFELLILSSASQALAVGSELTSYPSPLIDVTANPKGLVVPSTFLGIHLNRWKNSGSANFSLEQDYYQISGVTVKNIAGVATVTTRVGYGFYYYRKGVTVRLMGMCAGGSDFITTVVGGTLGLPTTPGVLQLANMPPKLGSCTIQYRPYIPAFGYGAVRSHSADVNWRSLHLGPNSYNTALMASWVKRHAGKKLMFTVTGTPEWLAASSVGMMNSYIVADNMATFSHAASQKGALPLGKKIKVRNCSNASLNGEYVVSASTPTSTSFKVTAANEMSNDTTSEILAWGNEGGYGYASPPKDMAEVTNFVTWLISNFGDNIDWIEGQNEANASFSPDGSLVPNQYDYWWDGTLSQLAQVQKHIYLAAKAAKPSILVGAPSITGLHHSQPINQSPRNRASGYQLLSASDGEGGKLIDWVDFVPFHVYDLGAAWQLSADKRTLYDTLIYLRQILASQGVNKPNMHIYMNEGGFEHYGNYSSPAKKYFDSLPPKQQANEIFKIAAVYAGYGVKGFYPFASGFLGDYETNHEIAAAYDKINKRIAGKTIDPRSGFNKESGGMFFKTTDGYEEYIP